MTDKKDGNPIVGIAVIIGGISIGIVAIIAIFSSENLKVAVWIIGFLSIMGIALGSMALKHQEK
ncbi:MAG: hypothetical protein KJN98_08320 [Pontiella sp.]|nr:hypothetical protein [Pontiella sp.]